MMGEFDDNGSGHDDYGYEDLGSSKTKNINPKTHMSGAISSQGSENYSQSD